MNQRELAKNGKSTQEQRAATAFIRRRIGDSSWGSSSSSSSSSSSDSDESNHFRRPRSRARYRYSTYRPERLPFRSLCLAVSNDESISSLSSVEACPNHIPGGNNRSTISMSTPSSNHAVVPQGELLSMRNPQPQPPNQWRGFSIGVSLEDRRSYLKQVLVAKSVVEDKGITHQEKSQQQPTLKSSDPTVELSALSEIKSCPICLTPFLVGDVVCWSPNTACDHFFHQRCIVDWLIHHDECPCCRHHFLALSAISR